MQIFITIHFGIGLELRQGDAKPTIEFCVMKKSSGNFRHLFSITAFCLILMNFSVVQSKLKNFKKRCRQPEFPIFAEKYILERSNKLGLKINLCLQPAMNTGVPVYTSSPGDSSIGMNIAAKELQGNKLILNRI